MMLYRAAFLFVIAILVRYRRRALAAIGLALLLEIYHNIYSLHVRHPDVPLDEPFSIRCQEPKINGPRENATILMLARNSDLDGAVSSLMSLEHRFNKRYHYPIVFLNDQLWDQAFIDAVTNATSGPVYFGVIEQNMWQYPEWIDQGKAKMLMEDQARSGVLYASNESYHHMCRFNSGLFYDHELLQGYQWYWRVEPGVRYTSDITYDPFVEMAENNKKYGYVTALWEIPENVSTFFRKISEYKNLHQIQTRPTWTAMLNPSYFPWPLRPLLSRLPNRYADGNIWNLCHFWSNFEIADMDFFRSAKYRSLFNFLDHDGGFYYERWEDAPVHSLAAALLLDPSELHHFADFGYDHAPFQYCPYSLPDGRLPDLTKTTEKERRMVGCRCNCDGDSAFNRPVCLNTIRSTVL